MPYFSFKGVLPLDQASLEAAVRFKDGTPALVSRTGYTGEVGFEIFCPADRVVALWQVLLETGQPYGIVPCGLAARDSLRAGAILPLSHQDIGHWPFIRHCWPFALPYNEDRSAFTKDFIGAEALLKAQDAMYTVAFVGFDPRKISLGRTSVVGARGNEIGIVLTCATDMGIGWKDGTIYSIASADQPPGFRPAGLSCGFVKVAERLTSGQRITIKDQRRSIEVVVVDDIRPARTARQALKQFLKQ
jgi:aminomethyltransferase